MRVLCALVAVVALAAAHHGGPHTKVVPDLFDGHKEYVYNYRALVATGLPRQSQQFAGLEKFGLLTVQVQQQGNGKIYGLHLSHVKSGSFDKEVEDFTRPIENVPHVEEETLEKHGPVFATVEDNQVQHLKTPEGMPEEMINIYRGLAALFTVGNPTEGDNTPFLKAQQYDDTPIVYRRLEEGITGNCETIYEVLSNPYQGEYLNITKTKNYMKCLGRDPRFLQDGHDTRGCPGVCPTHKPEQLEGNLQPEMGDWESPVTEGCPVDFHPKNDLVETFTTFNYNITLDGEVGIIHGAQALDKKILPIRKQQIKTVSLIQVRLHEVRDAPRTWELNRATKQYDDLTYQFPKEHGVNHDVEYLSLFGKLNRVEIKNQIVPMVKALGNVIVTDNIETKGRTGDKIIQLTMAIGALNRDDITELWGLIGNRGNNPTEKEYVDRKILLDVIALSGTNDAAEFVLELVKTQALNTIETVHVLETLQKNVIKPTTKLMDTLLDICGRKEYHNQHLLFSTSCIALAETVSDNCGHHHGQNRNNQKTSRGEEFTCGEQQYRKYIEFIHQALQKAETFAEQTIYIQTLARFGHPEAIKALIPYVYGEHEVAEQTRRLKRTEENEDESEYLEFIRQVTIYALHHSVKEHGAAIQPIVQGIYFNREENYELRIAAFSVLLATQPTEATFGRIVMELGQEQDVEVASYAYSALRTLANATLPCMQQTARRVKNVLAALPHVTYGVHHSKWTGFTTYDQLSNLGFKGQFEITQSNVSAIPRAIYGGLTSNKGPFVSTVGDFGFVAKGFENIDKLIHHRGGVKKIIENVMNRVRRSARSFAGEESVEKMLQQLEESFEFNTDENNEVPRAVVTGSFLGNSFFLPLDKEYVTKLATKAGEEFFKTVRSEDTKNYRFVRILLPRTYVQVTPGVNGLPVVLSNRHPIVFTLSLKDVKTRFGPEKDQLSPFALAVSGIFTPTVYHTSIHSALTMNPFTTERMAYGVRTVEQTHFTVPFDAGFQYTHHTRTFGFTFRPRFEKVFYHKTKVITFKTPALLIRGAEQRLFDRYTSIQTQNVPFKFDRTIGEKTGMALRVEGYSNNEEYAINFLRSRTSRQQNPIAALMKEASNEWLVRREWSVRMQQNELKPVNEIKAVFRFGNLLKDRLHKEQGHQQKPLVLSEEQLAKENQLPEEMKMISYDQEYEKITGRRHERQIEQSFDRIVKKTEKYWSQVDRQLAQTLTKENSQVRSLEYVVSTKGQKKPVAIVGHLIFASTLDKQAKLAEIKMSVEDHPISLDALAVIAFSPAPQPFLAEVQEQGQRGIIGMVAELETPNAGKHEYSAKVEMKKSQEQVELAGNREHMPWYYKQCEKDKMEKKHQVSYACLKTRYYKAALNELQLEVTLPEKYPHILKNATHKFREALKMRFYRNLRANYVAAGEQNKIKGMIVFSDQIPEVVVANITILTPDHEELHFERIAVPKLLRPSTIWSIKEQAKGIYKRDLPEPECTYNGKKLRTFDNVTISLDAFKQGQKYVLARDNDEEPKFTIVAEPKGDMTHVEILLRNTTFLKLTPPTQGSQAVYNVYINSTQVPVSHGHSEVRQYTGNGRHIVTFHVHEHREGQDTLVVKVHDQRVQIIYDGKNVKIVMAQHQAKGQLVGLCGDNNNQHLEEFTGPRGCIYEDEQDFIRSYSLKPEPIEGKWYCPSGIFPRGASQEKIQHYQQHANSMIHQHNMYREQRQQQRNRGRENMHDETHIMQVESKICFSTEPVKACETGYRQVQTERVRVPFTCFNKNDELAVYIQRDIQANKISTALPRYIRDTTHREIEVPTKCER